MEKIANLSGGGAVYSLDKMVDSLNKMTEDDVNAFRQFIEALNAHQEITEGMILILEPSLERLWSDWRKFMGCGAKKNAPSDTLYGIAREGKVKFTCKIKDVPTKVKGYVNEPSAEKRAKKLAKW